MKNVFDNINIINEKNISLIGMNDEFFCAYINKMYEEKGETIIILTSTLYEGNKIYNILKNYNSHTLLFPIDDFVSSYSVASSPELKTNRLETIKRLVENEKQIVILHLNSFVHKMLSKDTYLDNVIRLSEGDSINRDKLIERLEFNEYSRETVVYKTGDYGVRGFIIDIFPILSDNPIRIEFFGDEIESIREFDVSTQKSIKNISSVTIYPNIESYFRNGNYDISSVSGSIMDYVGDRYNFVVKDYNQIKVANRKLHEDVFIYKERKNIAADKELIFELDELLPSDVIYYETINNIANNKVYNFNVQNIENFNSDFILLNETLHTYLKENKVVIIGVNEQNRTKLLSQLTVSYTITDLDNIFKDTVNIVDFAFTSGYIYENYVIVSEHDIYNTRAVNSYKNKFKYATKIRDYNSLDIGDYVVHDKYGIGVYNGLKTLNKGNLKKDYIELLYANNDKLYIPVEKIDIISKYVGREGTKPTVHKLDSVEWAKTKLRIQAKVKDVAEKLLKLYASREQEVGFAFSKDNEMQLLFDQEFQYELTPDQSLAIASIKMDMESARPMDRLLCGDVGYGKTEVAFRAMFKAALDSKQVLYLCPTTILSKQQYNNAINRFKNYPVNIAVLNRFTSTKETKKILEGLEKGTIDILFGTHRILSDDVKTKDLGLLIVDEEQRFGVMHKEKIKELKNNIDVLSLTATPIPRTLQMSLAGIRSLSLIETPPVNRYPVETYVIEEDDLIVRDVIYKELSRNGQVYFLYNNVQKIEKKAKELEKLVPEAKIVIAHGQMSKIQLENIMTDFIEHKFDVLICTTIIETGIDISNVNTLIVVDADKFGLSQLYQIRGRVGRSDKIAYAYLMYRKDKILTETAIKRLDVIKEFTELGSGFAIASRDLSIRGAGDLLGNEQAGFIDNVGIDLYLKILNSEVNKLKLGEEVFNEEVSLDQPLLEVDTHIDDDYVFDNDLKIEIHRIINSIDSYDKLCEVKQILEDRFGRLSETMTIYMYEEWFEKIAHQLEITKVKLERNQVAIHFNKKISAMIDSEELFYESFKISHNFKFKVINDMIIIVLMLDGLEKHYLYYLIDLLLTIKLKND